MKTVTKYLTKYDNITDCDKSPEKQQIQKR